MLIPTINQGDLNMSQLYFNQELPDLIFLSRLIPTSTLAKYLTIMFRLSGP